MKKLLIIALLIVGCEKASKWEHLTVKYGQTTQEDGSKLNLITSLSDVMKYDKIGRPDDVNIEEFLKDVGADGWELVNVLLLKNEIEENLKINNSKTALEPYKQNVMYKEYYFKRKIN